MKSKVPPPSFTPQSSGPQLRTVCLPRNVWQCLETFRLSHLGRGQRVQSCCKAFCNAQDGLLTKNYPVQSVLSASLDVSWTGVTTISYVCIFFQRVKDTHFFSKWTQ